MRYKKIINLYNWYKIQGLIFIQLNIKKQKDGIKFFKHIMVNDIENIIILQSIKNLDIQ